MKIRVVRMFVFYTLMRDYIVDMYFSVDVEGVNHFPEDFEDMAGMRNDSARARRRERTSPRVRYSVLSCFYVC